MKEKEPETVKVFARGFVGLFLDAEFNVDHIAEMSQVTYKKLIADFPGADVFVLKDEEATVAVEEK